MISEIIAAFEGLHLIIQILIIIVITYLLKTGIIELPLKQYQKKKAINKPFEIHSKCAHFPSLVKMIQDALYKSSKIQTIKREDTIYDQINIFNDLFEDIFKILKSNYLTLYKNHNNVPIDGLLNNIQIKYYLSILRNSHSDFKKLTIKFMKENHFIEKSETEFRTYIAERSEDYQQALTEYLDGEYDSNIFNVSRERLYKSNMKCIDKINVKIEEFFYKVRDVSIKNQKKISDLEAEIKDFV